MAGDETAGADPWLRVIGKSLAYLCLAKATERDSQKYEKLLDKVKFLRGLGLSQRDAAEAAGSTPESVSELLSRSKKTKNGKAKKKSRR
jgi:hypothetical protein